MKIEKELNIDKGQTFVIDDFKPEDSMGIANLFLSIYGTNYPFDLYYYPERIVEANNKGDVYSVVARTPKGDIIGHGALYRSFPENKGLYELGQLLVLKDYRDTFAAFNISKHIKENLIDRLPLDGIFGEAVTNHTSSQKLCHYIGLSDLAIEIELMPESMYEKEHSAAGRVSCLFQFLIRKNSPCTLFLHTRCKDITGFVLEGLDIKRDISYLDSAPLPDGLSQINGRFFKPAGVCRFNIAKSGSDICHNIDSIISEAQNSNINTLQFIINVSEQGAVYTMEALFKRGFFIGGLLPLWFEDGEGFLLQRLIKRPLFEQINLFSEKSVQILNLIREDYETFIR